MDIKYKTIKVLNGKDKGKNRKSIVFSKKDHDLFQEFEEKYPQFKTKNSIQKNLFMASLFYGIGTREYCKLTGFHYHYIIKYKRMIFETGFNIKDNQKMSAMDIVVMSSFIDFLRSKANI